MPRRFVFLAACLLGAAFLASGQPPRGANWEFTPDPSLPNVLIIGDSISMGYTLPLRALLQGKANVFRPMRPDGKAPVNCASTDLGLKELRNWLGSTKWAVIHFNWGLHDLCYRNPQAKSQGNRDKVHGKIAVPLSQYQSNLEKLVAELNATGARLVWASTTKVPEGEAGRVSGDEQRYNKTAQEIMARRDIAIDDLHALSVSLTPDLSAGPGNVHYTAEGYNRMAAQAAASIEQALARK